MYQIFSHPSAFARERIDVHKSGPLPILNDGNTGIVLCLLVDSNNSLFRGGGKEVRREDDVEELVTVAAVVVFIICEGGIIEDVGV